jgi:hypothetical protein
MAVLPALTSQYLFHLLGKNREIDIEKYISIKSVDKFGFT